MRIFEVVYSDGTFCYFQGEDYIIIDHILYITGIDLEGHKRMLASFTNWIRITDLSCVATEEMAEKYKNTGEIL